MRFSSGENKNKKRHQASNRVFTPKNTYFYVQYSQKSGVRFWKMNKNSIKVNFFAKSY